MKQMTFADAEYAGERKQTRKELFLIEMDRVVPWKGLITLIDPHYPKGEGGRPAYLLMAMLRVHLIAPVRLCEDAFPWSDQEHGATGDAICAVKSVDGAQTFTDQCRRGAPVIWAMAAARCSRRLKTQK